MHHRVSIYYTIRACTINSVPNIWLNGIVICIHAVSNMNESITSHTTYLGIVGTNPFGCPHSTKTSTKHHTVNITTSNIHKGTRIIMCIRHYITITYRSTFGLYFIISCAVTNIGNITTTIHISIDSSSSCNRNTCISFYTRNILKRIILIRSDLRDTLTTTIHIAMHLTALN